MSWVKRDILRQNLAITIAVAALTTVFFLLAFSRSTGRYEPQLGEIVNYWQLLSDFGADGFNTSISIFILLAFVFAISLIFTPRGRGLPAIGVMLIALMLASFVCVTYTFSDKTSLTENDIVEYGEHVYRLVLELEDRGDYVVRRYILFECALADPTCKTVYRTYAIDRCCRGELAVRPYRNLHWAA